MSVICESSASISFLHLFIFYRQHSPQLPLSRLPESGQSIMLLISFCVCVTVPKLSCFSFTGSVKLKGIIISGEDDSSHPAEVRL